MSGLNVANMHMIEQDIYGEVFAGATLNGEDVVFMYIHGIWYEDDYDIVYTVSSKHAQELTARRNELLAVD
jgi:hypothetical protein